MTENEIKLENMSQYERDIYDKLTWMEENEDKLVWHSIEEVRKMFGCEKEKK